MIINPFLYSGQQLPELDNPGTAPDLLAGKQLIDQEGKALTGTMPQRSSGDLTASGATVTVPAGHYPSGVSKTIASAGTITGDLGVTGGASWNSNGINGSGTVSIKNVNQTAGYTNGHTNGTLTVRVPANRLLKGRTVTPTTAEQTIANAEDIAYGAIKVAGDANLKAANIKSGVSIFGVAGNFEGNQNFVQAKIQNSPYATLYFYCTFNRSSFYGSVEFSSTKSVTVDKNCFIVLHHYNNSLANLGSNVSRVDSFQIVNNGGTIEVLRVTGDCTITIN